MYCSKLFLESLINRLQGKNQATITFHKILSNVKAQIKKAKIKKIKYEIRYLPVSFTEACICPHIHSLNRVDKEEEKKREICR